MKGLNYTFAGEAAFIDKMQPMFVECGLSWGAIGQQFIEGSDYQTKTGTQMFRVRIISTFRLGHAESGEFEDYVAFGEATDMGDKALPKAQTIAQKYALRQAFLIETGDDPDRDASVEAVPQSNKITNQGSPPVSGAPQGDVAKATAAIESAANAARCDVLEKAVLDGIASKKFSNADGTLLLGKLVAKRTALGIPATLTEQFKAAREGNA